jgi:protein-disulfide isomerase
MEQKQLDDVEDSYFGEEFIDEEDPFNDQVDQMPTVEEVVDEVEEVKKENKKKAAKKKAAKKISASKVAKINKNIEGAKKVNSESKEEIKEDIVIKPVKEEPKIEEVKVVKEVKKEPENKKPLDVSSPVDPWADDEESDNHGLFKEISTWKAMTGIAILLLVVSVFTQGFHFSDGPTGNVIAELSLSEAENKVLDYVNANLLQAPFTAELESSEDAGSLYKMTLLVAGQNIDSYLTKDGKLFFPQGFDITENGDLVLEDTPVVAVSLDDDAVKGDANAPVTIIEFSDFECPFCGKYVEETYPLIIKNYVDTGVVKYVFRDFPLSFHQNAQKAAEAAECAGEQNQYWEMHDILFANNDKLSVNDLKGYAVELGLDTEDFNTCLDSNKMAEEVKKDMADGVEYGVTGTPAFFINGKLVSGAMPYESFEQEIEAALASDSTIVEELDKVAEEVVIVEDDSEEFEVIPEPTAVTGQTKEYTLNYKKWSFMPNKITVNQGDLVKLKLVPDTSNGAFTLPQYTFAIPNLDVEEEITGEGMVEFIAKSTGSYEFKCGDCEDWRGMSGTLIIE